MLSGLWLMFIFNYLNEIKSGHTNIIFLEYLSSSLLVSGPWGLWSGLSNKSFIILSISHLEKLSKEIIKNVKAECCNWEVYKHKIYTIYLCKTVKSLLFLFLYLIALELVPSDSS